MLKEMYSEAFVSWESLLGEFRNSLGKSKERWETKISEWEVTSSSM